jgi:hypothetical protein
MAVGAGRIFAINLIANSKPAEDAFKKVGQAAGRIPTPMKIAAAAITAVFAAVATVAIKSFQELLKLGEEFNEVTRIIQVGTGAAGADLAALEQSFRNVAAAVPSSFADVATVIAELDTRTDLAGDGLEAMAEQLLTLSRLMGGDARNTTREVTRLFNRFGLEAEAASDMLDVLFRASQASGASVDSLAADTTKYAATLQGMGFSLEESVALLAIFEREGVRSRTVMAALQQGIARLTRDGTVPASEALANLFSELQGLDHEAAQARGVEIFGDSARELIDAVRDGRLDIEGFTSAIVDGEMGIMDTAAATDGWRQALDRVKNNLKLQFEPIAREVFREVTKFVEELIPAAKRVEDAFNEDGLQGALAQIAVEWDRIYRERIEPLFVKFLEFLDTTVKPLALEIGKSIGAAIAAGMWSAFKSGVSNLFGPKFGERVLRDLDATGGQIDLLPFLNRNQGLLNMPSMGAATVPTTQLPTRSPTTTNRASSPIRFMANGGLVQSPIMGVVGEAGPEVVMPLDRFERQYGGGTTVINVTGALDAEGVARQIERILRDSQRRTGGVLV